MRAAGDKYGCYVPEGCHEGYGTHPLDARIDTGFGEAVGVPVCGGMEQLSGDLLSAPTPLGGN